MGGVNLPRGFESLPLRHFPLHNLPRTASKPVHNSPVDSCAVAARRGGRGCRRSDGRDRMTDRRADQASRKRARWARWIVLGVVLVGMTAIVTAHQKCAGSGRWAGVDFLCPFGGLETLYSLLAGDGFLRHTAASSVDPARRHARHGRRLPALVLRHALPARRRCRGSSAPPAASSSGAASPSRAPSIASRATSSTPSSSSSRSGPGRPPSSCCAPTTRGSRGPT